MAKSTMVVLLNLSRWDNPKKPGMGTSLDVVQEVNEGRSWGVGVEKVFFMENGAKRIPKKMERKDFKACAERWDEVLGLMENPPKVEPPPPPDTSLSGGSLSGGEGLGGGSLGGGSIGGGKIETDNF